MSTPTIPYSHLFALGLILSGFAWGEPVQNPIEAPIPKGPLQIELEPIAKGLAAPLLMIPSPDKSGRLFIVDQVGQVRIVEKGKLLEEPLLDVTGRLAKLNKDFDERGLLGLAFDPHFADPGSAGHRRLFTFTSERIPDGIKPDFANPYLEGSADHHSVLASWIVSGSNPNQVDPASRREIFRIEKPQPNHNAGMIAFGPDGFLYISLGDGGGANDFGPGHNPEIGNAQDTAMVLGKMLRIDVNGTNCPNGRYGIPTDNPFAKAGGAREIYAMGLRNPYRFSFDGNALLVGDVGQNKLEFVHRVQLGGNYGWRLKEGTFRFLPGGLIDSDTTELPQGLQGPVLQYDHDEGLSVIGGFVYRGKRRPELVGKYVFGDYHNPKTAFGRLFYGDLETGEIREFQIGADDRELGFLLKGMGYDADGEIYALGSVNTGPSGTTGVVMKIK